MYPSRFNHIHNIVILMQMQLVNLFYTEKKTL